MSTVTERAKALKERAEEDFAESWRPDKESPRQLVGEIVRYTTGPTSYGDKTICVVRDTEGREWSVWLLQAALVAAFARERPTLGEMVLVNYEGQKTSERSGRRYHAFKLVVEREKPALPDFDRMAADAGIDAEAADPQAPPASDVPADTEGLDAGEEDTSDIPF